MLNARVLSGVIALLACAAQAAAQCNIRPILGDAAPIGFDGYVYASTLWDPDGSGPQPERLVVGGHFARAYGRPMNSVAQFDGTTWQPMGAGLTSLFGPGSVACLAVVNGELYAGGSFFQSGATALRNIAKWDGAAWQPLGAGYDAEVEAMCEYDGDLIAAGGQVTIGVGRSPIWRWDGAQWHPIATGLGQSFQRVYGLHQYDGLLFAGGSFSQASGSLPLNYIAKWNGSQWSSVGSGVNTWVYGFTEFQGELVAFGEFNQAGGTPARHIASWNGSSWNSYGSGVGGGQVGAVAVYNGKLTVATRDWIEVWDGAAWNSVPGGPVNIDTLTPFLGRLWAGGWFASAGMVPTDMHIASWNGTAWASMSSLGVNGTINSIVRYGSSLFAGGSFTGTGPGPLRSSAVWDGAAWQSPGSDVSGLITCLVLHKGSVVVAAPFGLSPSLGRVARWDGSSWQSMDAGLTSGLTPFQPAELSVLPSGLYAAGAGLARWDGAAWQMIVSLSGITTGTINSVVQVGPDVVVGGGFSTIGGVPATNVARWDGAQWHSMGAGPIVNDLVNFEGSLIAGTRFPSTSSFAVTRWNGSQWVPMEDGLTSGVRCFLVSNGKLLAGTSGTGEGNVGAIASWNGAQWESFGTPISGWASTLVQDGGGVIAAGGFREGDRVSYWIRLDCDCYANCDNSTTAPILNSSDFACFINQYTAGGPYGNCDGSSGSPILTANDFICFLNRFAAGCE